LSTARAYLFAENTIYRHCGNYDGVSLKPSQPLNLRVGFNELNAKSLIEKFSVKTEAK